MRIVVVGGSGLVGAKLVATLRHRGHDLLAAAQAARVKHHVVLSIVGTDSACFRLHEAVQRVMHVTRDSRALVADPQAPYFGARLSDDTLTPDEGAIIGVGRFDDWLKQAGGATASN